MIYFPYADFEQTAAYFDLKGQKKQQQVVGEGLMELRGVISFKGRLPKEPPKHVQAWRGHERALARYGEILWRHIEPRVKYRGLPRFYIEQTRLTAEMFAEYEDTMPPWWGSPVIHESHLESLQTKDKTCIVWSSLPAFPVVNTQAEYDELKAKFGSVDPNMLTPEGRREWRLMQSAAMRFQWRR
jgi:hypothetical protein